MHPNVVSGAWLGRRDSNPRMVAPEATALPLGDSPTELCAGALYQTGCRLPMALSWLTDNNSLCDTVQAETIFWFAQSGIRVGLVILIADAHPGSFAVHHRRSGTSSDG